MSKKDDKTPPGSPLSAGAGKLPRRRGSDWGLDSARKPETEAKIERDELGNAVWKLHVKSPRRRADDGDIDPLDVLSTDDLSLEDDDSEEDSFNPYNPYNKSR